VRLAKAINLFDLLFKHAVREYRAGKTTNLRDFLAEEIEREADMLATCLTVPISRRLCLPE
jgi:hypothetical protein